MGIRIKYNSPVILTFALLCLIVMLLSMAFGEQFLRTWFVTARGPLQDPMTFLRMFTYVLGHTSMEHFISNMMLLLLVGPIVEQRYGSAMTLITILVTAFFTAIANMVTSRNGLIGCSGVVFAMIILCSMTFYRSKTIPLTTVLVLALYLGQEIYSAVVLQDQVSQMGHIIGGITGAAFGYFLEGGNRLSRKKFQREETEL